MTCLVILETLCTFVSAVILCVIHETTVEALKEGRWANFSKSEPDKISYILMENMLNCNFFLLLCWLVRVHCSLLHTSLLSLP